MDGDLWLNKYRDTELAKEFLSRFGGKFGIHPTDDELFYQAGQYPKWGEAYTLPESETEFWNMISKSVRQGKNLLLTLPQYLPQS